ncbi:hypothetical protein D9M68_876860 [compost metagenome]
MANVSEGQHRRGSMAERAENAVARERSDASADDIGSRAVKNLEASGQKLRPEVEELMKQVSEAQSMKHSQSQTQGQRL